MYTCALPQDGAVAYDKDKYNPRKERSSAMEFVLYERRARPVLKKNKKTLSATHPPVSNDTGNLYVGYSGHTPAIRHH